MGTMERILRLMADKKASDVYLSANAPAMIKINGQTLPINNQLLPADATLALLAEVLPAHRIEELEATGELNMAHAVEGAGNYRISAMRQRGSIAAVIRHIATEIPPLSSLGVPMILAEEVTIIKPRVRRRAGADADAAADSRALDVRFNISGYLRTAPAP